MLLIDQEAAKLHECGLRHENIGEYELAHEAFDGAQAVLAELTPSLDVSVQSARVFRDKGFNDVRTAVSKLDYTYLPRAMDALSESGMRTVKERFSPTDPVDLPEGVEDPRIPEVRSEHGATVGLVGRLATVGEVLFFVDGTEQGEAYETAHGWIKSSNDNGYYLVSNAMLGARWDRIKGRNLHAGLWLGRAISGLVWTHRNDPKNFKAAMRTFVSRAPHLVTYKAAVESVADKP